MSLADLIRRMTELGAPAEAIALAVEAIEAERTKDAERKAKQAERKRRSRDKGVTVTGQGRDNPGHGRDTPSPSSSPPTPPLTTTPSPADAVAERTRDPVDVMLEAIGCSDHPTWYGHKPRLAMWIDEFGWDLDLDILPTLSRVMAGRQAQGPPRSPTYFEQAIAEHRARRLAPAPVVNIQEARNVHASHRPQQPDWDAAAARIRAKYGLAAEPEPSTVAEGEASRIRPEPGDLDAEQIPGGGYRVR